MNILTIFYDEPTQPISHFSNAQLVTLALGLRPERRFCTVSLGVEDMEHGFIERISYIVKLYTQCSYVF